MKRAKEVSSFIFVFTFIYFSFSLSIIFFSFFLFAFLYWCLSIKIRDSYPFSQSYVWRNWILFTWNCSLFFSLVYFRPYAEIAFANFLWLERLQRNAGTIHLFSSSLYFFYEPNFELFFSFCVFFLFFYV